VSESGFLRTCNVHWSVTRMTREACDACATIKSVTIFIYIIYILHTYASIIYCIWYRGDGDGGLQLCDRVHSDEQCSPCSKSPNGAKLPLVGSQSLRSYTHNIIYTCTMYIILYVVCIVNTYDNQYSYTQV